MMDAQAELDSGSRLDGKPVKIGSNRTFGLTVGGIFAAIGAGRLLAKADGSMFGAIILVLGSALVLAGIAFPSALGRLNVLWMRFGLLLSSISTPIMMAILFFFFVTPLAMLMRLCGARPLDLKFDRLARSYWKHRSNQGFSPSSLERQF